MLDDFWVFDYFVVFDSSYLDFFYCYVLDNVLVWISLLFDWCEGGFVDIEDFYYEDDVVFDWVVDEIEVCVIELVCWFVVR